MLLDPAAAWYQLIQAVGAALSAESVGGVCQRQEPTMRVFNELNNVAAV
jgi:hypothetical protein